MNRLSARQLVLALVCVTAVSGCGAPTSGTSKIDGESIPYELLSPSPPPTPPTQDPSPEPGESDAQVFFVGEDDLLVPVSVALTSVGVADRASEILMHLENGPADDAPEALATALGPDVELRVVEIVGTTAHVDLLLTTQEPVADQIPLAIGQLVLTVTSVSGITHMSLLLDGEPVDVPLPGGQLTPGPVTFAQYQELIRATPT